MTWKLISLAINHHRFMPLLDNLLVMLQMIFCVDLKLHSKEIKMSDGAVTAGLLLLP